jgi:hypothetical protein
MKDAYRYYVLAYEDACHKRPIKHEHGGTTVTTEGPEEVRSARQGVPRWVGLHPRRVQGIKSSGVCAG